MQQNGQELLMESDDETRERIQKTIERSGYGAVRSLKFRIEHGVVELHGRFPTFYACQIAIESVKRVPGVLQILNYIEVVNEPVPQRDCMENSYEATPRLPSIVTCSHSEEAPRAFPTTMAMGAFAESAR